MGPAAVIRRPLGRTGIMVSLLALGTVKIGRNQGVKYPHAFERPDDHAVLALLDKAADTGINLIDTAPAYGDSETRLGHLLPESRGHFLVSTKVGELFDGHGSHHDFSASHTRRSVETSLHKLRRTQLDIVCIHSDGRDREILQREGALQALRELRAEGLVRAIGLSAKSPDGVLAAIEYGLDVVMATINPAYEDELPAIAEAHAAGLGVLVKKAMRSGFAGPEVLAWVASRRGVSSIVTGTINPAHLAENARAVAPPAD